MLRKLILPFMATAIVVLVAFGVREAGAQEGCLDVATLIEKGEARQWVNVHIRDDRRLKIFAAIGEVLPDEAHNFTEDMNAIVFYSKTPGVLLVFNEKDGMACRYVQVQGPYAFLIMNLVRNGKAVEPTGLGI